MGCLVVFEEWIDRVWSGGCRLDGICWVVLGWIVWCGVFFGCLEMLKCGFIFFCVVVFFDKEFKFLGFFVEV